MLIQVGMRLNLILLVDYKQMARGQKEEERSSQGADFPFNSQHQFQELYSLTILKFTYMNDYHISCYQYKVLLKQTKGYKRCNLS